MPSATDNIKHLILVMMENRSFDHFFGFLKSPDYPINGLNGNETNPAPDGTLIKVSKAAQNAGDLWPDPGHFLIDVNEQIFSNKNGTGDGTPLMQGFVKNYFGHTGNLTKARKIMKCFDPARIPVLKTLAQEYAICDNWFSSVPGPTLPNRAFVNYGTSMGRVDMAPDWGGNFKSIYELLDTEKPSVSTKIYFHDSTITQQIAYLKKNQGKFFGTFDNFLKDCKKGTLPTYTVVEPRFNSDATFAANDQHPDHEVAEGERLISDVYTALRKNKTLWESSMLVIVYDEHGGLFDHVTPPKTVNPDDKNSSLPAFDFQRLGVRVPAVVVSPYIKRGTIISTLFDHTSVIATARKLFTKDFSKNALSKRDAQANTLDVCLTLDVPRTDTITFPKPAKLADVSEGMGLLAAPATAKPKRKPKVIHEMSEFQLAMLHQGLALESELPSAQQSGKTIRSFKTEHDVAQYLRDLAGKLQAPATTPRKTVAKKTAMTTPKKSGGKK
ncbi:MAG: alkaline phosphatase family protein [Blastocatellia bacterium]